MEETTSKELRTRAQIDQDYTNQCAVLGDMLMKRVKIEELASDQIKKIASLMKEEAAAPKVVAE